MAKFYIRAIAKVFFLFSIFIFLQILYLHYDGECAPQLLYSSAKAGPNSGWENSPTKGAAITIWARDVGSTRGTNYVSVAGIILNKDSDYAEWGATTNPKTAKGMQRITFWLNNAMKIGDTSGIYVMINGVRSNILPFIINSPLSHNIIFVNTSTGLETNNGRYASQGSGNNGPLKYPFSSSSRPMIAAGTFMYLRGGTYTNIMASGWHAPRGGIIGVAEARISGCEWYYPTTNGTNSLRITMTSYPGEHARFFNAYFSSYSNYWTFSNFTMDGDLTYQSSEGNIFIAIVIGFPEGYCATCDYKNTDNQIIGCAFINYMHVPVQIWGNNHSFLANYVYNYPTQAGMGIGHDYNLYIASSDNISIRDNELRGGSRYNIQVYDETRNCPNFNDSGRGIKNLLIDSNLIDMNQSIIDPYPKWFGILTGIAWQTGIIYNTKIINNIIYLNDGNINSYQTGIIIYQEGATSTLDGYYIYNNIIFGTQYGIYAMPGLNTVVTNVDIKNNILSNIYQQHFYAETGSTVIPKWSYNLTDKVLSFHGPVTNSGNNILGSPMFMNPSLADFHLQTSSPAIGAGENLSSFTSRDYDWKARPRTSRWSIGAFEYGAVPPGGKVPSTPVNINVQ